MKKILFLINYDTVIYNFRLELVERLISEGIEVVISTPYGDRTEDLRKTGARIIETNVERHGTNPIKDVKLIKNYNRIIRLERPDVVLTFTIKPNIYGGIVASINNTKYMANITGLGMAVEKKSLLQFLTVSLYKLGLRKANCIFFQNEANKYFFIKNILRPKKEVLLPGSGVNLEKFRAVEYPKTEKTEFVFISRIMKEKGIEQYLNMAEYIHEKYPESLFHICGFFEEECYKDRIHKMEMENIVKYHGMVKNIGEIIAKTHCTIHPSFYPEGMSNVCLESAACGRPIITTDRSGCRETVDDGVTGYIVKQRDTNDLINKVEQFLCLNYDKKNQMGLMARKKMINEFDRQIVVEAYMRELKIAYDIKGNEWVR